MNSDPSHPPLPQELRRYSRQIQVPQIGLKGQKRISQGTALIVGCGALGSVSAESLARAGVGRLRIVDRDFLEWHNLQRQVLYDENDVRAGLPKAVAAQRKLRLINSDVNVEAFVEDVDYSNVTGLARDVDVILDGTDNFETRFLLNDLALDRGIPWVYGGCIGSEGQTMSIVPGKSNCLHCLMTAGPPPPGTTPGCDVAGILGPVVQVIGALQAMEAIKILAGQRDALNTGLTVVDLWNGRWHTMQLGNLSAQVQCPACWLGQRSWLSGHQATRTAVLCGRNAVQIRGSRENGQGIDLRKLESALQANGAVLRNEFLLKFERDGHEFTVFSDGRAIISGTGDPARARSLYAQWIGI